jgi:hypothetical protein
MRLVNWHEEEDDYLVVLQNNKGEFVGVLIPKNEERDYPPNVWDSKKTWGLNLLSPPDHYC